LKYRKWDAKTKGMIVMEGLKGKPVSDICLEYQISQTQYYRWRDKFLSALPQVFTAGNRKEEAQAREITRLKGIIGELTVELKKKRAGVVFMKRAESASVTQRNAAILETIKALKVEHPFWGYRRIWAHLKYINRLEVNKKRVLLLMKKHDLQVKPDIRLKALRTPQRSKPRPSCPNQWWGMDMTNIIGLRMKKRKLLNNWF
jgi:putative transposase